MTGDNVIKGYDWHTLRDIPPAHGSGKEPMYGSMGKSTKPDPNRKVTYPCVHNVVCIDSHNTSYLYQREDGTLYWHHCRKNKDDVYVDADGIQIPLEFGKVELTHDQIREACK